jgi:N-acetylglutamate synthase-like GNAT family acetyltransferase
VIRKAKLSDLPALFDLYDHLRGGLSWVKKGPTKVTEVHKRAMKQLIKDPSHFTFVATERGRVVGTCTLYILPRVYWTGRPWAILDSIVVAEDQQGQGTGSKLIKQAIKVAKQHKCSQVNLTSNTQRTRAHRFYESLGFEPTYVGFKMTF